MSGNYILDELGNPVLEPDVIKWAQWFDKRTGDDPVDDTTWRVGADHIGSTFVSTVFLGLDQNFAGGLPVLWETLVRGGQLDQEGERYNSRDEAKQGHAHWVARVKELPSQKAATGIFSPPGQGQPSTAGRHRK